MIALNLQNQSLHMRAHYLPHCGLGFSNELVAIRSIVVINLDNNGLLHLEIVLNANFLLPVGIHRVVYGFCAANILNITHLRSLEGQLQKGI